MAFAKKVKTAQQNVLNALDATDPDYASNKEELDNKIAECSANMQSLCSNFWRRFKILLGAAIIPEWHQIVEKETQTEGYIAKNGKRMTGKCGLTNAALTACIC